jgi:hypothetical protein
MNPDQLERLRTQRPFEPFTIHVSDGVKYEIPSPEYIIRTKSGRSIAVLTGDGETFAIIDMLHVTRLTNLSGSELAPEEPRRRPAG